MHPYVLPPPWGTSHSRVPGLAASPGNQGGTATGFRASSGSLLAPRAPCLEQEEGERNRATVSPLSLDGLVSWSIGGSARLVGGLVSFWFRVFYGEMHRKKNQELFWLCPQGTDLSQSCFSSP